MYSSGICGVHQPTSSANSWPWWCSRATGAVRTARIPSKKCCPLHRGHGEAAARHLRPSRATSRWKAAGRRSGIPATLPMGEPWGQAATRAHIKAHAIFESTIQQKETNLHTYVSVEDTLHTRAVSRDIEYQACASIYTWVQCTLGVS